MTAGEVVFLLVGAIIGAAVGLALCGASLDAGKVSREQLEHWERRRQWRESKPKEGRKSL